MAVIARLDEFLKRHNVPYKTIPHREVYTSQEIAGELHVKGMELAKVVMVKAKNRFVMAVLPASHKVDIKGLKEALGEKDLRLAAEDEFKTLFPDCEVGAEPPFGNLYGLETFVDKSLSNDEHIYFNAGNHVEAVEMDYADYSKIANPKIAKFAMHL